jgi:hypothetical protein
VAALADTACLVVVDTFLAADILADRTVVARRTLGLTLLPEDHIADVAPGRVIRTDQHHNVLVEVVADSPVEDYPRKRCQSCGFSFFVAVS